MKTYLLKVITGLEIDLLHTNDVVDRYVLNFELQTLKRQLAEH